MLLKALKPKIYFLIRFPSGMKALGDYIHNRGLKYGIYEDYGNILIQ